MATVLDEVRMNFVNTSDKSILHALQHRCQLGRPRMLVKFNKTKELAEGVYISLAYLTQSLCKSFEETIFVKIVGVAEIILKMALFFECHANSIVQIKIVREAIDAVGED